MEAAALPPDAHYPHRPLRFRPLLPTDRERVEQLHEAWFPVRYEAAWYETTLNCGAGHDPYYTMAAVEDGAEDACAPGRVVALITAHLLPASAVDESDEVVAFSFWDAELAYILTLGVDNAYRQRGIATQLLAALRAHIDALHRSCRALYLHTLSDNVSALAFYRSQGFERVARKQDFYSFSGAKHDAVVLAAYMNGGAAPSGALAPLWQLMAVASSRLSRWLGRGEAVGWGEQ